MKITEETIKKIAEEYCRDKTPLSELAKKYGTSKSTLVRYFNGERSIKLPIELQKQVDEVKKENWIEYKSTSGNLGHKSLSEERIKELAEILVEHGLSLEELSKEEGPSKSTLYNLFAQSVLGEELYKRVIDHYKEMRKSSKKSDGHIIEKEGIHKK